MGKSPEIDFELAAKFDGPWPDVTCILPTYGRFNRLRHAIACFILQDYPGKRLLVICNDAPTPLCLTEPGVCETRIEMRNESPYPEFSAKKQAMLDSVTTEIVAHWEDDDLYMPWHLSTISILQTHPDYECLNSRRAWRMYNPDRVPRQNHLACGPSKGKYDGGLIFRSGTSVPYRAGSRGIAQPVLEDYVDRDKMLWWYASTENMSYVYRINDGLRHLCRCGLNDVKAEQRWKKKNIDFGDNQSLLPNGDLVEWAQNQIRSLLLRVLESTKDNYTAQTFDKMCEKLPWVAEEL